MKAIGPYRITGRLGGGRNARVLTAANLGATFAIKLFSPSKRRQQRMIRRGRADPIEQWQAEFEREANLLADIQHPTIVKILDRGQTDDGNPYLVMPLYPDTLATRLWGTHLPQSVTPPLDGDTAREILTDILDGAGELHRMGIVHRDLKLSYSPEFGH